MLDLLLIFGIPLGVGFAAGYYFRACLSKRRQRRAEQHSVRQKPTDERRWARRAAEAAERLWAWCLKHGPGSSSWWRRATMRRRWCSTKSIATRTLHRIGPSIAQLRNDAAGLIVTIAPGTAVE